MEYVMVMMMQLSAGYWRVCCQVMEQCLKLNSGTEQYKHMVRRKCTAKVETEVAREFCILAKACVEEVFSQRTPQNQHQRPHMRPWRGLGYSSGRKNDCSLTGMSKNRGRKLRVGEPDSPREIGSAGF